jgi:hypothetical protein
VSGAVVDKQTNHPLDSAAVYKLNKPYDEAVSDTSGFFEVSSISGGLLGCPPMTVIVSKAGYQPDTVEIENGESDTIRFKQNKGNRIKPAGNTKPNVQQPASPHCPAGGHAVVGFRYVG